MCIIGSEIAALGSFFQISISCFPLFTFFFIKELYSLEQSHTNWPSDCPSHINHNKIRYIGASCGIIQTFTRQFFARLSSQSLINGGLRNEKKRMEIFNYGAIMAVGDFLFQSRQPLNWNSGNSN